MTTFNLDANWTHWVRENLIRGSDEATIAGVLRDNFSVSIVKAHAIIQKVRDTPLPKGNAQPTADNEGLKRREWMMKTLDTMARLSANSYHIDAVEPPAFNEFVDRYYSTNHPVILKGAFDHWQAKLWTPEHLAKVIGNANVEVQYSRETNPTFEMDSLKHKKIMPFSEYHHLVQSNASSNDFYMTANNAKQNQSVMAPLFEELGNFSDGYFNESDHLTRSFVWYGPKGNYTPLHHDQTNNMFLQVYGRKRFLLVPPNQTPYLYNKTAVFSPIDLRNLDKSAHPLASKVTPIDITVNPGDTLFIPVGWWHQVESLDVSISVTMTNFNAPNAFV